MKRYSSKTPDGRFAPLFAMLTPEQMKEADILGRAMRFGAMLWLDGDTPPGTIRWNAKARHLTLMLAAGARPLYGEVAEARLAALAQALDATFEVKFKS